MDPGGRGPGADVERICAHQRSLLPKATPTWRRVWALEAVGGAVLVVVVVDVGVFVLLTVLLRLTVVSPA